MVRDWFITVEVNSVPVDVADANIDIQDDGQAATITIDGIEGDFDEGELVTGTATATTAGAGKMVIVNTMGGEAEASDARDGGENNDQ